MNAMLQTPSARLAHSRAQLRLSLHDAAAADPAARRPPTAHWLDELRVNPGLSLAAGVLGHWWSRHPLRAAADTATAALAPIAQRHPLALLAGAFVTGGVLAWSRPWRWSGTAVSSGLLAQLLLAMVRAAPARPQPAARGSDKGGVGDAASSVAGRSVPGA